MSGSGQDEATMGKVRARPCGEFIRILQVSSFGCDRILRAEVKIVVHPPAELDR